ncbi:hypothetical protein FACS1894111_05630 [Clostridia bacterium]|nr:hypothetical protein FACS1894111_05630 [Clostridia bacterium]
MAYTVTGKLGTEIKLVPETVIEEVLQNVEMIVSTIKNTAPLYRDFGLSARFLDKPTPVAEAILIAELFEAIEEYEPRAEVINATFERDERTGKITPRLEVKINA